MMDGSIADEFADGAEVPDVPDGYWERVRKFCESLVPVPEEDQDVPVPDPLI